MGLGTCERHLAATPTVGEVPVRSLLPSPGEAHCSCKSSGLWSQLDLGMNAASGAVQSGKLLNSLSLSFLLCARSLGWPS